MCICGGHMCTCILNMTFLYLTMYQEEDCADDDDMDDANADDANDR